VTTPFEPAEPPAEPPPPVWLDPLLKWLGLAVAVWGGALLALLGAFLTPLRWGTVLIPVAIVLVVAGNILLIRWTHDVTGSVWASFVPGLVWLIVTLVLSSRTNEGDLVLTSNNWVATACLLAGPVAIGVTGYRLINPRRPSTRPHIRLGPPP
jgi:hypothetical protein